MTDLTDALAPDLDLDDEPARETWRIHSDREASWALHKLAAAKAEHDRIEAVGKEVLDRLRVQLEADLHAASHDVNFFEGKLVDYRHRLEDEGHELPKTYKLPGGTIYRRKQQPEFELVDADAVTAWAVDNSRFDLLKIEVAKSGLRNLTVIDETADGSMLVDSQGEIVPGVARRLRPDTYGAKPV